MLDADADGVLSIDVITKVATWSPVMLCSSAQVFHLVQAEGEDIKPDDLSILVKLIEKENVLTYQDHDSAKPL